MRSLIETIRSMPPAGQRRLALIVAVTASLLAAVAIYTLHRTMPVPDIGSSAGSTRMPPASSDTPASGAADAAATGAPGAVPPERPSAGPSDTTPVSPTGAPTVAAGAQPAEQAAGGSERTGVTVAADAAGRDGPRPGTPAAGGGGPGVQMRESGAPVSLRVPMPPPPSHEADPRTQTPADGSRRDRVASATPPGARTQAPAAASTPPPRGRPSERTERPGAGGAAAGQEVSAPPGGRAGDPASRAAPASTSPAPAAAASAQRLGAQQQAQCGDSSFVARFICDERVRLRFCRDRWNEHPDCNVETPRNSND